MESHAEIKGGARDMTPLANARGVIPGVGGICDAGSTIYSPLRSEAEQRWMQ